MNNVKRLQMQGISKSYPGCKANDNISLEIGHGEIHALLGENGAGKSTLMKVLYGVVKPDQGVILFNGEAVEINQPADARALGIGMVFQHFSLFETLTVKENIELALGKQAGNSSTLAQRIRDISHKYQMPLDPNRRVATLSTGERQRVEIVRCLLLDIQLLILDEPTSVLTPQEVDALFITLKKLSDEGCSILFISHKLHEVAEICSAATILRGGKVSGHCNPKQQTPDAMARMMVGDGVEINHQTRRTYTHSAYLKVTNLSKAASSSFDIALNNISLTVNKGEILGIAGVAGNGQEALLKALSGETTDKTAQSIFIEQTCINALSPMQRRRMGVAFVPEERLGRGAVPEMDLAENALLTSFDFGLVNKGFLQWRKVVALTQNIIQKYKVKTPNTHTHAASLSGGNLQKFIIGREVEQQPKLLLMSHPTWGVDIGAQVAIHQAILDLRDKGCAVLVISEDLDELYKISDRLCAICDGQLSPILPTDDLALPQLGRWMAGDFMTEQQNREEAA
ncbi:ABC transporter ATP-binding protein [Catenovulum sp. 2E275]|uniref:ABC transporter ATP-binding protein n=1 Tax=Catenovulum sp. 2E275 TaxID=2980497 RepID=UPI0021D17E6D|nr:ABC transporter ATP-binding protein [Catenovulum sp. 2E275]MCU4676025.1 ABC transporter ATP-binding protein [Catenovulum sp. 2E275]